MGQAVKYDDAKHVCYPTGGSADSRKTIPLQTGLGVTFLTVISIPSAKFPEVDYSCNPTTYSSAKTMANAVLNNPACKMATDDNEGNTGYDFVRVDCKLSKDQWDDVGKPIKSGCGKTEHWGSKVPHFQRMNYG